MAYGLTSVREVRNTRENIQSAVSIMIYNELQIIHLPHKGLSVFGQ